MDRSHWQKDSSLLDIKTAFVSGTFTEGCVADTMQSKDVWDLIVTYWSSVRTWRPATTTHGYSGWECSLNCNLENTCTEKKKTVAVWHNFIHLATQTLKTQPMATCHFSVVLKDWLKLFFLLYTVNCIANQQNAYARFITDDGLPANVWLIASQNFGICKRACTIWCESYDSFSCL